MSMHEFWTYISTNPHHVLSGKSFWVLDRFCRVKAPLLLWLRCLSSAQNDVNLKLAGCGTHCLPPHPHHPPGTQRTGISRWATPSLSMVGGTTTVASLGVWRETRSRHQSSVKLSVNSTQWSLLVGSRPCLVLHRMGRCVSVSFTPWDH